MSVAPAVPLQAQAEAELALIQARARGLDWRVDKIVARVERIECHLDSADRCLAASRPA